MAKILVMVFLASEGKEMRCLHAEHEQAHPLLFFYCTVHVQELWSSCN